MTEDHVFPEDGGTNSGISTGAPGDTASGANFGNAFDAVGDTDFVVSGLNITNASSGTFDVTAGKAVVTETNADTVDASETRDQGVAYTVEVSERTGLSYTTGSVNHVYLNVLLDTDDSLQIDVNTTATTPAQPALKIAEIDDT